MKRHTSIPHRVVLLIAVLLLAAPWAPLHATNLTGTFKTPDGALVNGKLIFLLSQPARLSDNSAQIVPMVKIFAVTNGALEANAFVYGNDVLVPAGTYYRVRLVDNANNLLFEQKWSITGTNLDLGTLTPTTTSVVVADPLIKNLTTNQAVQGPVTFSSGVTAFSLTLNGNLSPGAPVVYDLGSGSAAWREIFAQRWANQVQPGGISGTCNAPTAAPSVTLESASGGFVDTSGRQYKIVYFNRNGQTTASPATTFAPASGTTNKVKVRVGDDQHRSGCPFFRVYASSDGGVNFFQQAAATNPYQTTGHVVPGDAILTTILTSGGQPPTTNTATIDPIQVALNLTSDYANNRVSGILSVTGDYTLTTPLVVSNQQKIQCGGNLRRESTSSSGGAIRSTWTDPDLATVMVVGGPVNSVSMEGCEIVGTGHALMLWDSSGGSMSHIYRNNSIRSTDVTNTYSAVRIRGVFYSLDFEENYLRGGKAAVSAINFGGAWWTFSGVRWDLGGANGLLAEAGVTDPDRGANRAGFPNAAGFVVMKDLFTEGGTGIIFDCMNMGCHFYRVQNADPQPAASTPAILRYGVDANGSGASTIYGHIESTSLVNAANYLATIKFESNNGNTFNRLTILNSLQGNTNAINFNTTVNVPVTIWGGEGWRPYEGAATGKFINLFSSPTFPLIAGVPWDGTTQTSNAMNSLTGGIRWSHYNSPVTRRRYWLWNSGADQTEVWAGDPVTGSNKMYSELFSSGGKWTYFKSDGSSPCWTIDASGGANLLTANCAFTTPVPLTSTLGTGTAPFSIASTTEVANLNAQQWHGKQAIDFSAALDFPSIAAQTCATLTITATGAAADNAVAPSWPTALEAGLTGIMHVTASDTVTVRLCNITASAIDPASRTYAGRVMK